MKFLTKALLASILGTSPAWSQDNELTWMVCTVGSEAARLNTSPVRINWERDIIETRNKFRTYVRNAGLDAKFADCSPFSSLDKIHGMYQIGGTYQTWDKRTASTALFPGLPKDWHLKPAPGYNDGSAAAERKPTESLRPAKLKSTVAGSLTVEDKVTPSKYIEVPGPNGMIRLSPEVAARNKAAAEEYQRKIKEHSDAVAQAKAKNERSALEHAAALARHAESVAKAAAEKRDYERKLASNAAEVAAREAKVQSNLGGTEGTFQATSKIRATREEAMYEMTSHPHSPISNVQCKEVTFYKPARWTCWGTYKQTVTRSATSKQ